MIIAKGRTLLSISTYVRTMRVFSSATVLLTFISHARFNSGSHILTIGTLADETHITFSMPSIEKSEYGSLWIWAGIQLTAMEKFSNQADILQLLPLSRDADVHCRMSC